MRAFELVAAALPGATGPTSASPAARTAPPIHVFMRALPGPTHQPRRTGPPLAGPSHLAHKQLVLPAAPVAMMVPLIAPVAVVAATTVARVSRRVTFLYVTFLRACVSRTVELEGVGALLI